MTVARYALSLVIDKGNSRTKLGIFNGNLLIWHTAIEKLTLPILKEVFKNYPAINYCIMANVAQPMPQITKWLANHTAFIPLSHTTALPFKNKYQTETTLGQDRIAIAAAAHFLNAKAATLIINCGTCITYDFINAKNEYLGGSISPGLQMRFQALAHYTQKLPLVAIDTPKQLIGNTTHKAILTGVVQGIVDEITGKQARYVNKFKNTKTFITGGNALFLAKQIKNEIFATPHLTLIGLNEIIKYTYLKKDS
jgi:type III pantothenate kinase